MVHIIREITYLHERWTFHCTCGDTVTGIYRDGGEIAWTMHIIDAIRADRAVRKATR